jgi:DNA modification methylase
VQFVIDFKEAKGSSIFATIDRDFAEQKFIGSEIDKKYFERATDRINGYIPS